MGLQFITKRFRKRPEKKIEDTFIIKGEKEHETISLENEEKEKCTESNKNKSKKGKKDMITKEQISALEMAAEGLQPEVKIVKKDRGLIERTESSKIIITEDNRQVLND